MKLDITQDELNVILNHLSQGRFIDVAGLLNKITAQVQAQLIPKPRKVKDAPTEQDPRKTPARRGV